MDEDDGSRLRVAWGGNWLSGLLSPIPTRTDQQPREIDINKSPLARRKVDLSNLKSQLPGEYRFYRGNKFPSRSPQLTFSTTRWAPSWSPADEGRGARSEEYGV
ncbi:hypothetical protein KQX54_018205 [Cotesia glomerata]|uniref:Uncharacterized protein n=1 Tax=Cotesia glomerata TaxID=32391 RepID=A0AAV7HZ95_COTGL|nr:hypothetical protein KQX54_018205 [Cotesia glomerata]